MNPLDYARALVAFKKGLAEGASIPRIERALPARVASGKQLDDFRRLTSYPDDGYLPITYPHVMAFAAHFANMLDKRFPLPLMGTIHIRSRIRQHRPIGGGEALRLIAFIEGQRQGEKGLEFDLVTHAYVGPELVWEGAATMLRKKPRDGLPPSAARPALDGVGAINQVWKLPTSLAPGFAFNTGDLNPIHLSGLSAKIFGFDGVIIHGMWSLTRMAGMHPKLVVSKGVELNCDFKLPIVLPNTVVYRYWPTERGFEQRLLDKRASKPHVIASLTN